MNALSSWQTALLTSWGEVWISFVRVLPGILGSIVIFAIGLVLAFWVKKLVGQFLQIIKFEKLSAIIGVEKYLTKAEIKLTFSELIAAIFEWLVILVFFLAVVDILGLSSVSLVLARVLGYIPNVLAASLIFAAGYFVAGLVDTLVRGALISVDHELAKPVGKFARGVILVIAFFAALDQLQIARGLISTFFQGLTYTIVLIVGLAVGLGSKDLVTRILNDWYEKIKK